MREKSLLSAAAVIAAVASFTPAHAEPRASYVNVSKELAPSAAAGAPPRIIYLNRNAENLIPGQEDPSTNMSSLISSAHTIGAWPYSDGSWLTFYDCMKQQYGAFNITVTDQRPAGNAYVMLMAGGVPEDIGMSSSQVGGVSPFTCDVMSRAITFSFAGVWGDDPQTICEVAAQETGHAFGLEHEFYCPDPMTYLGGCGPKYFRDYDAPCGEFSARPCCNGPLTQNSVQRFLQVLGPGEHIPPTLTITAPMDGATVKPGFMVTGMAMDNFAVSSVELDIDGSFVTNTQAANYSLAATPSIPPGPHQVDVIAYDQAKNKTQLTIHVTIGSDCAVSADCPADHVCADGVCMGDIGASCTLNGDCASDLCLPTGQTTSICSWLCDPADKNACPSGFSCETGGGTLDKCFPASGGNGWCAASAGGAGGSGLAGGLGALFTIGLLLAFARARSKP